MTDSITIDRCYCEAKSFAALTEIAHHEGLDLRALAAREGCGTHCGWCIAYLRRALLTGETEFHALLAKETLDSPLPTEILGEILP
jgi:bacterioferritin-associated ferredoxin